MPPPSAVRLGLVGAGAWGRNYVSTIRQCPGVHLSAVASRNPATPDLVGPDCPVYSDWREMIAAGGLDGIVVSTIPAAHAEIALSAMKRGVAVLIEKPLTLSAEEARALENTATRLGAIAFVDHIDLFNPAWRALERALGSIAPVQRIYGTWAGQGPFRSDTPARWDWGALPVAAALNMVGRSPDKVTAELLLADDRGGEMVHAELVWSDGPVADLAFGNLSEDKRREMSVEGDGGVIRYNDQGEPKAACNGTELAHSAVPPLRAVVVGFAAAIRRGHPDHGGLSLGSRVVAVLARVDAAIAS